MQKATIMPPQPRTVASFLIKTAALDASASHAGVEPGLEGVSNWEMHRALTDTLESWQTAGTLRENSLLLLEWLAVELVGYLLHHLGGQDQVDQWVRDFGDQVCQAQQRDHPAGPTAVDILSVMADDAAGRYPGPPGHSRLKLAGASYLLYLRDEHRVKDAREMALTLTLWAGAWLASLMSYDLGRITAYIDTRKAGPRS